MYDELVKSLRVCSRCDFGQDCNGCTQKSDDAFCCDKLLHQAADAIEKLTAYVALYKDGGETAMKVANDYKARIEELQAQLMYSNDAAKVIAEKVPKWIPVTERLPDWDEDVLVTDGNSFAVGYYRPDANAWDSCEFGWIENRPDPFPPGLGTVTHWMRLPTLPKEELA